MRDLAQRALNAAQVLGASYADVRLVEQESQQVAVKDGQVAALSHHWDSGFGVRALVNGAWGFASSARLELAEVERIAAQVVSIARASARVQSSPGSLMTEHSINYVKEW